MIRVDAELEKKNINIRMFAAFLGVAEKTAWNKRKGLSEFTISEALKTKKELFPEYDIQWLFGDDGKEAKH